MREGNRNRVLLVPGGRVDQRKKGKLDSRIMYVSSSKEKKSNIEAKYKSKKKESDQASQHRTWTTSPFTSRPRRFADILPTAKLLYFSLYFLFFSQLNYIKSAPFELILKATYPAYEKIAEVIQKITKWHINSILGGLI